MLLHPFSTRKPKKPGKFNSAVVAEKRDSSRNDPDLDGEKLDEVESLTSNLRSFSPFHRLAFLLHLSLPASQPPSLVAL
jgi:hypothetical protein